VLFTLPLPFTFGYPNGRTAFHAKRATFLPGCKHIWILLAYIDVPNITRQVGAALMHADRRTDMTKVKGAFRDYANAAEKQL
jgi:hypothetical protein